MTKTAMFANLVALPDQADEVEAILRDLVASTEEEAGTEVYVMTRDPNRSDAFWFFELYTDEAALGAHAAGSGMAAALVGLDGKLAEAPMLTQVEPLAAKGLAL